MKEVVVLTDFANHDQAYSLCRVVMNQVKMLVRGGYAPTMLVRKGWPAHCSQHYEGTRIVALDPGKTGSNIVEVTPESEAEILSLETQLREALPESGVVLTHDLIYQPNMWKYHVATRRIAKERQSLRWLHWVHSSTDMGVADKVGRFREELKGKFPHSRIVAMHPEEVMRKASMFGYELDEAVLIPNPIDFLADFDPAAKMVIEECNLMRADIIAVYPCRLDRGKQPHVIMEIFAELKNMGFNAWAIFVDFHSNDQKTSKEKSKYRDEIKRDAEKQGAQVFFTSDLPGKAANGTPYEYLIPHKAVMDLMALADFLIHPSRSECDPLIVPEAAWSKCGLLLNWDLPLFRQYQGHALFGRFSSHIDVTSGMPGETKSEHPNRKAYMHQLAACLAYQMTNNPVLALHAQMRKTRSLEGTWSALEAAIEMAW